MRLLKHELVSKPLMILVGKDHHSNEANHRQAKHETQQESQ